MKHLGRHSFSRDEASFDGLGAVSTKFVGGKFKKLDGVQAGASPSVVDVIKLFWKKSRFPQS